MHFSQALDLAIQGNWTECMRMLRMHKDLAKPQQQTKTTLLVETIHLFPPDEFVYAFVKAGGDVNAVNNQGYGAIHALADACAESQALHYLDVLSSLQANIEAFGYGGWTPLHFAARNGCVDFASKLIGMGLDVDIRADSPEQETPLMVGARVGCESIVQLFLQTGAQTNLADTNGWTAATYAQRFSRDSVLRLLKRYPWVE